MANPFRVLNPELGKMILQTARHAEDLQKNGAFLAYCPRCKDRVRFDGGWPGACVCNCTVAKWGSVNEALRFTGIKGHVTAHQCNAKCMESKSGVCECSCGGHNHGRAWS